MTWFRVDDSFYDHPKVTALDDGPCADHALALWLRSGVWCAKQLKDGFISDTQVRKFSGKKKAAEELVRVRLWERVEGGFQFRNWSEYQPTRDQVEAKREKTRNKVTEWRSNQARNQVTQEVSNRACNPAPVPTRPDPTLPDREETENQSARGRAPVSGGHTFELELAIGSLAPEGGLKSPPKLTHTQLRQVSERIRDYAQSSGVAYAEVLPLFVRSGVSLALARSMRLANALMDCQPGETYAAFSRGLPGAANGIRARPQRSRATTAADFENEPELEEQLKGWAK